MSSNPNVTWQHYTLQSYVCQGRDTGDPDISDPIRILFALFSGESLAAPGSLLSRPLESS